MSIKWLPVLCLVLFCAACAGRQDMTALPRPQAGYLNLLEKNSMARQADELVAQVSQTERIWLNNGRGGRADTLLKAAPVWLEVNGFALNSQKNFFPSAAALIKDLKNLRISGLYLGPLAERQNIWLENITAAAENDFGGSGASLEFDPILGQAEEYEALAASAEEAGLETGADLLAAATDAGPDFLLQARNVTGHAGLYAMLQAPEELWPYLPETTREWDLRPVSREALNKLHEYGIPPASLARDSFNWTNPGGWAATGEVKGADGKPRRWLYRHDANPRRPVMLWQDPSGLAQKIFAASIIWQTGISRQTLVGLRLGALFGLEPGEGAALAPGPAAINALAAQIHRYGGWALQADPLPPNAMEKVLAGPCDFCADAITPALVAYALATGDAKPLVHLYKNWIEKGLDQSRLARNFNLWRGVDFNLLNSLPDDDMLLARLTEIAGKLPPSPADWKDGLKNYNEFMLSFSMGLPGLVFLNPGDLLESAERHWPDNLQMSDLQKILALAPENNRQLIRLVASRAAAGLAGAKLESVTAHGKTLVFISRLPQKGFWLMAANFSAQPVDFLIGAPPGAKHARGPLAENLDSFLAGADGKFRIALDGTQVQNVVFEVE